MVIGLTKSMENSDLEIKFQIIKQIKLVVILFFHKLKKII